MITLLLPEPEHTKKQNKLANKKHISIFVGIMNKLIKILLFFFLLLPLILSGQNNKDSKSSSSVLSSGKWFRIAVTEDGIYRIDYSRLSQLGLDNPANPRIFCNNTGQLSYYNNDPST